MGLFVERGGGSHALRNLYIYIYIRYHKFMRFIKKAIKIKRGSLYVLAIVLFLGQSHNFFSVLLFTSLSACLCECNGGMEAMPQGSKNNL